ncbi:MAG TPA: hypothetical protein VN851_20785 [Thermoanaerobaculia bacterium]|nr:hypothetical protein [Thermoanaerobaculia bacterium]
MSAFTVSQTTSQTTIGAAESDGGDDLEILAAQFRALRRLHSSVEHLLHSPLNSIGLNLELLSVEIGDLAKRAERDGEDPERFEAVAAVQKALRAGYARLVGSTETIYEVILPGAQRVEEIDLARLARRAAGLGETESVLMRAAWSTAIPPVPITMRTRRDLLVPALLTVVASILDHAGADAKITFSLTSSPDAAEIEAVVEPGRPAEVPGSAEESRSGLALLARRLGGSCREGADETSFRIHLSLPRLFGAAAC